MEERVEGRVEDRVQDRIEDRVGLPRLSWYMSHEGQGR